jgi:tripartite-type tricarboxylate transporter receptor subunit TctC
MKLELTNEQVQVLQIALSEMFNSDDWIEGVEEDQIDIISERAAYLLKTLNSQIAKTKKSK